MIENKKLRIDMISGEVHHVSGKLEDAKNIIKNGAYYLSYENKIILINNIESIESFN